MIYGNLYVCGAECDTIYRKSKASEIVAPLSQWILKSYEYPNSDIQHLFENALTEFLNISFNFPIDEVCNLTETNPQIMKQILDEHFGQYNNDKIIRFANSDTWTLENHKLSPILHKYLKIKFGATFQMLSQQTTIGKSTDNCW